MKPLPVTEGGSLGCPELAGDGQYREAQRSQVRGMVGKQRKAAKPAGSG